MIRNNHWLRSVKIGARKGGVSHFPVQSKAKVKAQGSRKRVASTVGYFQTSFEQQPIDWQRKRSWLVVWDKSYFALDANAMLITLSVAKFFVHRLPLQELSVFLFN